MSHNRNNPSRDTAVHCDAATHLNKLISVRCCVLLSLLQVLRVAELEPRNRLRSRNLKSNHNLSRNATSRLSSSQTKQGRCEGWGECPSEAETTAERRVRRARRVLLLHNQIVTRLIIQPEEGPGLRKIPEKGTGERSSSSSHKKNGRLIIPCVPVMMTFRFTVKRRSSFGTSLASVARCGFS